ncbi:MAG TPA: ligase-associated DNA damage response endonuclease PdeM [Kiloniellales bacterium]|nr:ligase-associated DNA damage response endonuclease PdeM [Kiloniellales bacterium]
MNLLALELCGTALAVDPEGALWWPERRLLAVADLHLEKASSLARRGHLLPPYDTRATLARLARLVERHRPALLLCLGDSFHDVEGPERLAAEDRAALVAIAAITELLWVEGNHDPGTLPEGLGRLVEEIAFGPLLFRHQAARDFAGGEVSGHYHPKATVFGGLRRVTGRCFVTDGRRLILPAFGQLTGGLDVLDRAYRPLFPEGFEVVLLGERRAVRFPAGALV